MDDIVYKNMATSCAAWTFIGPNGSYNLSDDATPKRRNILNLYRVYLVNAYTGSLLSEYTVVGKDEGEAAIGLKINDEEKALKASDDLEIIWQKVGSFEKREVQRVRNS